MKIAIDINGIFGKSGISQYVKLLIKNLAEIDQENEYFLYTHFWKKAHRILQEFSSCKNFRFIHFKIPETAALLADFKFNLSITERFLAKRGVEIYHGTGNMSPKFKNIKSVLTIHHYYPLESPLTPVDLNWKEKFYFRCTDYSIPYTNFIITDSKSTKSEITRRFSLKANSIKAIYPGEPNSIYRPIKKKEQGKYILFSGPVNERKNLPHLLTAYSILLKKGLKHKLFITGTGKKEYLKMIGQICLDYGIQDKVSCTGIVSDEEMVRLYNTADLLIYPSLYEGFGYPPLEAMACGCPVVASNVTSIPEIVGDAGILFDPRNVEEMAQVIEKVLKDSQLRQELIKKGFEQVKKFSWKKTAKETLEVYKKVYSWLMARNYGYKK